MPRLKLAVLSALLALGLVVPVQASLIGVPALFDSIAFDTTSSFASDGSGSVTRSHTITGSNTFLACMIVGDTGGGADDVNAPVFDGTQTMAFAHKIVDPQIPRYVYLYTLVGPHTGTHNVVATSTSAHFIAIVCSSYTGVSQTGQPEVIATPTYSEADGDGILSNSITVATANSWVILGAGGYAGGPFPQASTGSTLRVVDTSFGLIGLFDSNGPLSTGSQSLAWAYSGAGGDMGNILIAIAPAASATTVAPRQLLLGCCK